MLTFVSLQQPNKNINLAFSKQGSSGKRYLQMISFSVLTCCTGIQNLLPQSSHRGRKSQNHKNKRPQDISPSLEFSATLANLVCLPSGSWDQAASSTVLLSLSPFTLCLHLSSSSPRVSGPCGTPPLHPLFPWSLQSSACGRPPSAKPWSYPNLHQPGGSGQPSEFHSVCLQLSGKHARPFPEYHTADLREQAPEGLLHLLPTERNALSFRPTYIYQYGVTSLTLPHQTSHHWLVSTVPPGSI